MQFISKIIPPTGVSDFVLGKETCLAAWAHTFDSNVRPEIMKWVCRVVALKLLAN